MISANVVLPTPGGPQKIIDGMCLFLRACLIGPFTPTIWSWPMNSSILVGLIRSANGVVKEVKIFDLNITQF